MNKKRLALILSAGLLASLGIGFWFVQKPKLQKITGACSITKTKTTPIVIAQEVTIVDYDTDRDKQEIIQLFKDNWYWLIASDEYDVEHFLDTTSPNKYQPEYSGTMHIKVMHAKDGKFVGFVAYFKKNFFKGDLRFVVVKKDFRGHGYGKQLTKYGTDALFDMGVLRVKLVTRTNNYPAQKVYKALGYTEISRDGGFVDFEKRPAKG